VLIQNGVGVEQPYRTRFPTTPIISAVTVISAEQTSPGTVRQHRWTRIHLGPYTDSASLSSPGSETTNTGPRGDDTTGALTPTGAHHPTTPTTTPTDPPTTHGTTGTPLATHHTDWWTRLGAIRDVDLSSELALQTIRWHKLCINAAFNPSSILSGGRGNADMVRSDPELRAHLAGVMREIWDAAPRILGRGFGADMATPERILKSTERNVGSKPSMLLDWEAGRPLEVEVILGNPVRIARARGVELPRLQTVYALVRSMQAVRDAGREREGGRGKL
jgi:ketopantoate reductase